MTSKASIILEEYNDSWPGKFEQDKNHLIAIAGQWNFGSIEHVGSTTVPGMVAKPIFDIMFGFRSLNESVPAIRTLVESGYCYWPYKTEVIHWFCKPSAAFRTHHLHLVPFESQLWQERIKFRELLCRDKSLATEYANLKKSLAAKYRQDREAYKVKKGPFILSSLYPKGAASKLPRNF